MQKTAEQLQKKLSRETPPVRDAERKYHAAVSAIVCEIDEAPHVLFIQRTESPHDPWSGHLAFPGGRIDPEDVDLRKTAERETLEEVGLDTRAARYLGCLPPSPTLTGNLLLGVFVYTIDAPPELTLDEEEVATTHWIPTARLVDPSRVSVHEYEGVEYPAINILDSAPVLWGLTLRICRELFGHSI